MQTLEAVLSLLVFLSIVQFILYVPNLQLNTSLYKYYQVNDVYRVLYLKGDFNYLNLISGNAAKNKAEVDLKTIGALTGNCYFIRGIDVTNCRQDDSVTLISTEKVLIVNGTPQKVTISIAKKQ
ncbi:MAG: hypothetical protein AABX38_02730 [Candidatus Micrarchaeota archaeon]